MPLCNRVCPHKITMQLWMFSSELQFISLTANFSTSNDLQYTIFQYICKIVTLVLLNIDITMHLHPLNNCTSAVVVSSVTCVLYICSIGMWEWNSTRVSDITTRRIQIVCSRNEVSIHYIYIHIMTRFARKGLIHVQFQDKLLSVFDSYINRPTVYVCNIAKQFAFTQATFWCLFDVHKCWSWNKLSKIAGSSSGYPVIMFNWLNN